MNLSQDKITATLVFLTKKQGKRQKVLLAQKVRKLIVNCFNGFGGSIHKGEKIRACAVRELRKESGLVVLKSDLEFAGVMIFHNQREDLSWFHVKVFIFLTKEWKGKLKLKEDEMINPWWFDTGRLPMKRMAPADHFWLPLILKGQKIKGQAWYGPNQKTMTRLPEIKVTKHPSDID